MQRFFEFFRRKNYYPFSLNLLNTFHISIAIMKIPLKIRILLWLINKDKSLQIYRFSPEKARLTSSKKTAAIDRLLDFPTIPLFHVFDEKIQGRNSEIPVRIYQPVDEKDLPVIVYFHGGGFVISSVETHDKVCRRIARDNRAIVISVDYRLAPEYKFPIPVHDCYDATVWVTKNAKIHQGDVKQLVVMGDSAGGNLATAVSLMSRDLDGPKIKAQVLIYPTTDGHMSCESIDTYAEGYLLTKKTIQWFVNHYQSKKEDLDSPYLSMLLAEDLSNLPPAFVSTAEYDPLKDEGRKYAKRMKEAGNKVVYKDYEGLIHGFISMPKMSEHILVAYDDIQDYLTNIFTQPKVG
jgi:acetyl esterase